MSREDALVSLIVPIYNAENFLRECVESIIKQNYLNWELILINDGSTDASANICREFVVKDKRIRYFEKKNGGVSSARNVGIQKALGKYITFIDADDVISEDYCKVLLDAMKPQIGMVVYGLQYMYPNGQTIPIKHRLDNRVYKYLEISKKVIDDGTLSGFLFHSACAILYRKDLIDGLNLKFDTNLRYNEDGLFNVEYLLYSRENVFINYQHILYSYRMNEESATHKVDKTSLLYIKNMEYIREKLLLLSNDFPDARISLQIQSRDLTVILERLIYMASMDDRSFREIMSIIKETICFKKINNLDFKKMNFSKKCFIFISTIHFNFLAAVILKLRYGRKK